MSKHTPGPWFAKGRYIGTKNHMSLVGECRDVNGDWTNEAPASANARLIAAAPELLAELDECRKFLEDMHCQPAEITVAESQIRHSAVLAVIAKATGSEQ